MALAVTAACGKAFVRTALELPPPTVRPRSPLVAVAVREATVTAGWKVRPWSVDLRIWIRCGEPATKSKTQTVWSVLATRGIPRRDRAMRFQIDGQRTVLVFEIRVEAAALSIDSELVKVPVALPDF